MGNLVYPTLPGRAFPSGRSVLPPKVHVRTTPSQREFRSRDALLPRYQYSVPYEWLRTKASTPHLQTLLGFYNQVGGSFDSFLYLDPDDNTVADQLFGTGDGSTTQFQLLRSFGGFAEPVSAPVGAPVVLYNGQPANLLMNSSFENQAAGYRPYGYLQYNSSAVATSYLSAAGRTGGAAFALRADAPTSGTFGLYTAATIVDPAPFVGGVRAGWVSGATYSLSFYAKKVNGAAWSTMVLGFDVSPAAVTWVSRPALSGGWQRFVATMTWGTSVQSGGRFYLYADNNTATNDQLHVDDIQVVIASAAPAYVAGNQSYTLSGAAAVFDVAPLGGDALTWSGQFYRRCRFLGDKLDTEKFMAGLFSAKRVEFISCKD